MLDTAEIVYIAIVQEVLLIGCFHRVKLAACVYVPAFNDNLPLTCPHCFATRQWRFAHEEPKVIRGGLTRYPLT